MNDCPTVLFQPPNHVGLGHINRLSAIALALQEMHPSVRSVFVVEGSGHVLLDALNLPFVPLPSDHALFETEHWSAGPVTSVSPYHRKSPELSCEPFVHSWWSLTVSQIRHSQEQYSSDGFRQFSAFVRCGTTRNT